jgi:hypothetical protein
MHGSRVRCWQRFAPGRWWSAMGTMLHAAVVPLDRSLPELNLSHPALVRDLHAAYISAGARILRTNTFGANRLRLAGAGLDDSVSEINIAGRPAGPGGSPAGRAPGAGRRVCRAGGQCSRGAPCTSQCPGEDSARADRGVVRLGGPADPGDLRRPGVPGAGSRGGESVPARGAAAGHSGLFRENSIYRRTMAVCDERSGSRRCCRAPPQRSETARW